MKISKISQLTGNLSTMELDITNEQIERYNNNDELIQDIFPKLSVSEREFLITGTTEVEWNTVFGTKND